MYANVCYRNMIRQRNEAHRKSSDILSRYGFVAVEKLRIRNMAASARETVENPGRNVRQKVGLNREILSQRWAMLRKQLAYKTEWAGRELIVVDPRYTSKECSRCGTRRKKPLSRYRVFECLGCGLLTDRDLNAVCSPISG